MNTTSYAKKLFDMGYLVMPIDKNTKKMKYIKGVLQGYKNGSYDYDNAESLIKKLYFEGNDLSIMLNGSVCVIDIDADALTPAKTILNKLFAKYPILKTYPYEKTKKGYHIYANDLKQNIRSIKCISSSFLDIEFDQEAFNKLSLEEQNKIKLVNGVYILPIDYLTTFTNTPGICRAYPSTNIEIINEMVPVTELKPFPEELLNNIINGKKIKLETKPKLNKKELDTCSISSNEGEGGPSLIIPMSL